MKQCPVCKRKMKEHLLFCPFDGNSLVAEAAADEFIGIVLDDKYRLDEKVGEGGMGAVYKATHIHMDHIVAVKILHSHLSSDESMLERFRREARAAAHIRHPHAVTVTDFGVTRRTGIAYLVMEFLEGMDLRAKLDTQKQVSYDEAFLIAHQTCSALHVAHSKNIIHRDLKPDNIWLCVPENGETFIKVLDFGIAKLKTMTERHQLTQAGTIIGTPHYMSPEQCRGDDLDVRSDLYSLGVILYEMLTGQVPFQAANFVGIVLKHNSELPRPLRELRPDIPESIETAVLRALEKEPQARQQTAMQLAQELETAMYTAGIDHQMSGQNTLPTFSSTFDMSFPPRMKTPPQTVPPPNTGENPGPGAFYSYDHSLPDVSLYPLSNSQQQAGPMPPPPPPPDGISDSLTTWTRRTFGLKILEVLSPVQQVAILASAALALILILITGGILLTRHTTPGSTQGSATNSNASPGGTATPGSTPVPPQGMAYIPGGDFIMGYNGSTQDTDKPEHPAHVDSFFLDRHEVTNEEYYIFIKAKKLPAPDGWAGGKYPDGKDRFPVTNISWVDANAYCQSVDKRLPTEKEWEYAARGKAQRLYPWGDEFHPGWANTGEPKTGKLAEVGKYPNDVSKFDILDMAGNAQEWTSSDFTPYQHSTASPQPGKTVRGGSFMTPQADAMTTARAYLKLDYTSRGLGCRCAKDVAPQ